MALAVVLMSGGMDSCVSCSIALQDGYQVAALHVNYGQRTQERELQAFNNVCDHYNLSTRLVVDISHLAAIGGSALTDVSIDVPSQLQSEIPITYVPFRNANILAIATSWAEVIGATAIYIGAVEEDSSGYPDCREQFFADFERVIDSGTRPETRISIKTPLIALSKSRIVQKGIELGSPLSKTWSCYSSNTKACGTCDSCRLRARGFEIAGIVDTVPEI